MQKRRPEGLGRTAEHVQCDDNGQYRPQADVVQGIAQDADGKYWHDQVHLGEALNRPVHPAAKPGACGSHYHGQNRGQCRSHQTERQGKGQPPQQWHQQVSPQIICARPAMDPADEHKLEIHVCVLAERQDCHDQPVVPRLRSGFSSLRLRKKDIERRRRARAVRDEPLPPVLVSPQKDLGLYIVRETVGVFRPDGRALWPDLPPVWRRPAYRDVRALALVARVDV